ncbi:MAG TPA: EAL domain-containing protein [Xanthomonadaceae bacterium]|jgi:EAL domain-containing protein (putative c-di-GMP-specific phosphodiesterase class I)/GGDEF domain-containing protein
MADDAIHEETDGEPTARRPDATATPTALLLFPINALPPDDWHTAWAAAGWKVVACDNASEVGAALDGSPEMTLFAVPWPGSGDMTSASTLADELQFAVSALGTSHDASDAAEVTGGMMRRADFLAHLAAVMRAPDESGCCALLAIRVDRFAEFASRLDRTAIFDLEEALAERFAGELHGDDAYTIWLEFGFGVLVRREHAERVHELARRICARVAREPFEIAGESCGLTVSIGVALPPRGYAGADRWFAVAHAAQAIAVRHGGNRHDGLLTRAYEPIPAERVLIIREWVEEAKTGNNVLAEFQPVLPLKAGAANLYTMHTKLRDFRDPLGGVYRREYLRLARDAGAMVVIDRIGLFRAFEALEQERSRGRNTRLMVPVEPDTLEGTPWRWLQAELRRRLPLASGLVLELEGGEWLLAEGRVERLLELATLGVGLCVHDRRGGLEQLRTWSRLPLDLLMLQADVVERVAADDLGKALAFWRDQGRAVIVDEVDRASDLPMFRDLGVDYLRGPGVAAIGPRLDYDFE